MMEIDSRVLVSTAPHVLDAAGPGDPVWGDALALGDCGVGICHHLAIECVSSHLGRSLGGEL